MHSAFQKLLSGSKVLPKHSANPPKNSRILSSKNRNYLYFISKCSTTLSLEGTALEEKLQKLDLVISKFLLDILVNFFSNFQCLSDLKTKLIKNFASTQI